MSLSDHVVCDVCWLEVITHAHADRNHSEVICIHCQKIWFSNARTHVIEHLKNCKELLSHLWKQYQSSCLQSQEKSGSKKHKQSVSWMNRMKNNEAELLDELLAEFFYDTGIALSLMSDSYSLITIFLTYIYRLRIHFSRNSLNICILSTHLQVLINSHMHFLINHIISFRRIWRLWLLNIQKNLSWSLMTDQISVMKVLSTIC